MTSYQRWHSVQPAAEHRDAPNGARIDEIRERLNKARPGLAEIDGGEELQKRRGNPKGSYTWTLYGTYADVILLVNAPADLAWLLGEVERLSAERMQPEQPEPTGAEVRAAAEESTTDLGSIRDWYAGAVDEYRCDTGMLRDEAEAAFDRAIAAHDRALREQIAQKIEVEMRRHDNAQIGFSAVGDAYAHAARIARGEWWA